MSDIFIEQIIKRQITSITIIKRIFIIIGVVVTLLMSVLIPMPINLIVQVGIFYLAYQLYMNSKIEYEYIFTSGILDVDKIINQTKRKKIISIDVKDIEIMAPLQSKLHQEKLKSVNKKYDCSTGEVTDNTYFIIFIANKERVNLVFSPSDAFKKAIKPYMQNKYFES